jgi:tetratricopeptide (TPR) repeat protein
LTYRNGEFVTMLAPLRDYLSPKDPKSSSLLCMVKECYFARMSVRFNPDDPGFAKTQWITSEDVNVEHLLDVFTTIDASSTDVWEACAKFMEHLYWHKKRLTILGPKIEGLPDDHSSKPECLRALGWLFNEIGNLAECKRLLTWALGLWRERGSDLMVAEVLRNLSGVNREMGLYKEGIEQAREAVEINKRLGDTSMQASSLINLAFLLQFDEQLDAAEDAVSRAINLIGEKGNQFQLCASYRTLGEIYRSKGEIEKAVSHLKMALEIATPFDWHEALFWTHGSLASLFLDDNRLEDAQAHIEHSKLHTVNSTYYLAYAMWLQASVWYKQRRFEEARSEALSAADTFEKLGAASDAASCVGSSSGRSKRHWTSRPCQANRGSGEFL